MSNRPVQRPSTPEEIPDQFSNLINNWRRVDNITDLGESATLAQTITAHNELLAVLRRVMKGQP